MPPRAAKPKAEPAPVAEAPVKVIKNDNAARKELAIDLVEAAYLLVESTSLNGKDPVLTSLNETHAKLQTLS